MLRFIRYYGQFQDVRGRFGGLPAWARWPIVIAAIPGLILGVLSIFALLVSILALLLLTVPMYRLMQLVAGSRPSTEGPAGFSVSSAFPTDFVEPPAPVSPAGRTRRQIDVKIVE